MKAVNLLSLLILLGTNTAWSGEAMNPLKNLSLEVSAKLNSASDATVTYSYHFRNHGPQTLYLPYYGEVFTLRAVEPKKKFLIEKLTHHPRTRAGMLAAPKAENILQIPGGESKTLLVEETFGPLLLEDKKGQAYFYRPKEKGIYRLKICYSTHRVSMDSLKSLIPEGASFWEGEICADSIELNVENLPED